MVVFKSESFWCFSKFLAHFMTICSSILSSELIFTSLKMLISQNSGPLLFIRIGDINVEIPGIVIARARGQANSYYVCVAKAQLRQKKIKIKGQITPLYSVCQLIGPVSFFHLGLSVALPIRLDGLFFFTHMDGKKPDPSCNWVKEKSGVKKV